jgi:hypothetical protein
MAQRDVGGMSGERCRVPHLHVSAACRAILSAMVPRPRGDGGSEAAADSSAVVPSSSRFVRVHSRFFFAFFRGYWLSAIGYSRSVLDPVLQDLQLMGESDLRLVDVGVPILFPFD